MLNVVQPVLGMLKLGSDKSLDLAIKPSVEVEELSLGATDCIAVDPKFCLDEGKPSVPSQRGTSKLVGVRELRLRSARGARVELGPEGSHFSLESWDVGSLGPESNNLISESLDFGVEIVHDLLELLELVHD